MVVAVRNSPVVKGRTPKLNMLELVSVANNRYKVSKLRKRILPQGFCYVCSRVDPGGVFRNPNSHLFKKGFFHTCEHFPQAPFTTFVRDDGPVLDRSDTKTNLGTSQTAAPSISVTIRKGSRSTKVKSPVKREGTFGSSVRASEKLSKTSDGDKVKLPSLSTNHEAKHKTEVKSPTKVSALKTPSGAKSRLSRKSLPQTELEPIPTPNEKITIPTGKDDGESAMSGLSTFTRGTTPTKSADDLDFTSQKDSDTSYRSKMDSLLNAPEDLTSRFGDKSPKPSIGPFINQTDGLQGQFVAEPLIREVVMLNISDDMHSRRPVAGRSRRLPSIPTDRTSARSTSTYRPGSGHLRYHHRVEDDSVPYQGFEMAPTPSDDLPINLDQMTLPIEDVFDSGSSHGVVESSIGDDASLHLSDKAPGSKSRLSRFSYENRSFCRCATEVREVSFARNICRTCGKACTGESEFDGITGSRVSSKTRQLTRNDTAGSSSKRSLSQRMSASQPNDGRVNLMSKPYTDEDYMDLNSIIHEDDGHYFSGDDDEQESSMSPTSWYRYKRANPMPLVDPDIHKLAYLNALRAAKLRSLVLSEDLDMEEFPKLRRATVFSYIPLLPYRGKDAKQPEYLGLRPDDSNTPKKGQYMKHIFGNTNPDDFYPGRDTFAKSKVIIDNSSAIEISTDSSESKPPPNELERSSVSLKLRNSRNDYK